MKAALRSMMLCYTAFTASAIAAESRLTMLLELWVNGDNRHIIAPVTEEEGALLVGAKELEAAGIKTSPAERRADGRVDLYRLAGVNIQFSDLEQRLTLNVPLQRLVTQAFDVTPQSKALIPQNGTGFLGQYDLSGTADNLNSAHRASTAGAVLGGTFFTPQANLTATGFTQTSNGKTQAVRLDTAMEIDRPDTLKRAIAGDAVTGSQSWSRSVRFAGVQIATDFSMRPDLNTMPLPAFFGQTAVPANVDVFVNSAKVFETGVQSGPFAINNLPVITGNGEASVVVRDVLGRETTMLLPFYASSALLRPGLESYDLGIGVLRRDYGLRSFAYGQPIASGSYSRGLTSELTGEGHAEFSKDVQMAGGGGVIALSPYGLLHPSIAVSNSSRTAYKGMGALYSLAFESRVKPVSFFGNASITSGHFNDIASLDGTPPADWQLQAGSSLGLGNYGSLSAALIGRRQYGQATSRIATGSYNLSLGSRYMFGASALYERTRGEFITQGFLSVALGGGTIGSANVQAGKNSNQQSVSLSKPANPDGGFGYQLTASSGDQRFGEADAAWIGPRGTLSGSLAERDGNAGARVNMSGGLVYMNGSAYATRPPGEAVALVRTGQPGTKIYQENRLIAVADKDGEAMLTNLVPYARNQISIDPSKYNLNLFVEDTDKTVTPGRSGGVTVDFTPKKQVPKPIQLVLDDESNPPPGSRVTLSKPDNLDKLAPSAGGAAVPLIIGRGGQLFLNSIEGPVSGIVSYRNQSCRFETVLPATPANTVRCHEAASGL